MKRLALAAPSALPCSLVQIGTKALDAGVEPDELTRQLHDRMARGLGDVHPGVLVNLEWATPSSMATLGLIRWHRKQREAAGSN